MKAMAPRSYRTMGEAMNSTKRTLITAVEAVLVLAICVTVPLALFALAR